MSNNTSIASIVWPGLLFLISLLSPNTAVAAGSLSSAIQAVELTDLHLRYSIRNHIEFYEDIDGNLSISDVSSDAFVDKFEPTDNSNLGYTDSAYWLRFSVVNHASEVKQWYLVQRFTNMHYLDMYIPQADGSYQVKHGGNLIVPEERDVVDRHTVFQFALDSGEKKIFYLRAKSGGSMHLDLQIMQPRAFAHSAKQDHFLYGIFHGVLIIMLFYNAIIFLFLRDAAYKWLIIYIASVIFASSAYQGFLQLLFSKSTIEYSMYIIPVVVPAISISLLQFTDTFLTQANVPNYIRRINRSLIGITLLELLFIPDYVVAMTVMGPVFLVTLLFCIFRLVYAYKNQISSARWYALSWVVMLLTVMLASMSNFGYVPVNAFTSDSYLFGLMWMVLFMSVALADRVNKLKITAEQSESALKESESQRQMVMAVGKLGLWSWEVSDDKIVWSSETEAIFGLKKGEFGGTYDEFYKLTHPDDLDYLRRTVSATIKNNSPFYVEYRIIHPDGDQRWVGSYGKLEVDAENKPLRLRGTLQDITEFKQTKEELRDSELNYLNLFQTAADGFVIRTLDGEAVDANPAVCKMYGYTKDEYLQLPVEKLVSPESLYLLDQLREALSIGRSYYTDEAKGIRQDGTQFYLQVQANIIQYQGKPHVFIVLRDITKDKKLNDALKHIATGVADKSGLHFFQHLVLHLAHAYQAKYTLIGIVQDDTQEADIQTLAMCYYGKIVENIRFSREGTPCDSGVADRDRVIIENACQRFPNSAMLASLNAESMICEHLFDSKRNRLGFIWVIDDRPRPDIGELNELMQIFATRAAAEIERMQAEELLKQGNIRLEELVAERTSELTAANMELESFSYSVSHDLRAPLRAIDGFAQLLHEDIGHTLTEEQKLYLEKIRNNSQHMAALIDDLLQLSRVTRKGIVYKDFNLSDLVRESIHKCDEREHRDNVEITIEPNVTIKGDRGLMAVAIDNLVSNAWKYTRKTSPVSLEFGTVQKQGITTYYLKDNGAGFDMKFADKLFVAFHRLHRSEEYEGTGIGLATVARIIKRHGGNIWAESAIDKGATFYFNIHTNKMTEPAKLKEKIAH